MTEKKITFRKKGNRFDEAEWKREKKQSREMKKKKKKKRDGVKE